MIDTPRFLIILTHRAHAQPNWTSAQKDNANQSATLESRACPHCGKVQRGSGGGLFLTVIWLNIKTTTLRESEYISATPTQQATWLKLLAYCAEHENGGVIDGAGDWNDRAWLFGCGVTLEEVRSSCGLWWFDQSGNLSVWNYPVEKELEVSAKREAGRRGGITKAQNRSTASSSARAQPVAQPVAESDSASSSASTEGVRSKGKEEGGKEGGKEGNMELSSAVPASAKPTPEPAAKTRKSGCEDADQRHHEITSRIKAVYETATGKPFIMDGRFVKRLQVFLSSAPDITAEEYLETYRQAVSVKPGQFTPSEIIKAHTPSFFTDNFMIVRGLIERNQNGNENGNHSRTHKPSSRNGEGYTLTPERAAWLDADKLDGPPSHRD